MVKRTYAEVEPSLAQQVVRVVLIRGFSHLPIRRDHIVAHVNLSGVNFDKLLTAVRAVLEEVYGLTLQAIGENSKVYRVVDNLSQLTKERLNQLWLSEAMVRGKHLQDNQFFLPQARATRGLGSNHELVKMGVLTLVMMLVVALENRLRDQELIRYLQQIGISPKETQYNTSLGCNLLELITEFVKREYLVKESVIANNNNPDEVYSMGRRGKEEFPRATMHDLLKSLQGNATPNAGFAEKAEETLGRVYGTDACDNAPHNKASPNAGR